MNPDPDPGLDSGLDRGQPVPGKRGRRQSRPDPGAGPVAAFAHELGALKLRAGDPSYDRMRTELGAAASKSALSAAARGRELPSWETVWEFVRCLAAPGTDPEPLRREWRGRWEATRAAVEGEPAPTAGSAPGSRDSPAPIARLAGSGRERRMLTLGLAVGAALGASIWLLLAASTPEVPPIAGDAVAFVDDVTIPDGTRVRPEERFVKTWALRNTGSVPWVGRFLVRLPSVEGVGCRTPDRVPVPTTAPGATARISVVVDAAPQPTRCKVYWKVADEAGRPFFPMSRPMFFDVTVQK